MLFRRSITVKEEITELEHVEKQIYVGYIRSIIGCKVMRLGQRPASPKSLHIWKRIIHYSHWQPSSFLCLKPLVDFHFFSANWTKLYYQIVCYSRN